MMNELLVLKNELASLRNSISNENANLQRSEDENRLAGVEAACKESLRVFSGKTSPSDWQPYSGRKGAYVNIDYSHLRLTKAPNCTASLHGSSSIWGTTGGSEIYRISNTGFSIYVRYWNGGTDVPASAIGNKWFITYICTTEETE